MIIDSRDDEVLEHVLFRSLNMSAPLQSWKWISFLEADDESGFRIQRNLNLGKEVLGFTFSSNRFGLRGPCDPTAPNAIFETSYAMGFSVDDGENWYDGVDFEQGAMNLGLPVGMHEHRILFDRLYSGSCSNAIVLYHPNIWAQCANYTMWRESGKNVFDCFRWEKSVSGALKKTTSLINAFRNLEVPRYIVAEIAGKIFLLDKNYARFQPQQFERQYEAGIA